MAKKTTSITSYLFAISAHILLVVFVFLLPKVIISEDYNDDIIFEFIASQEDEGISMNKERQLHKVNKAIAEEVIAQPLPNKKVVNNVIKPNCPQILVVNDETKKLMDKSIRFHLLINEFGKVEDIQWVEKTNDNNIDSMLELKLKNIKCNPAYNNNKAVKSWLKNKQMLVTSKQEQQV